MNKGIVTDVFETLGGTVKATGQQAVSDAKKMGEDVAVELGLKTQTQATTDDSQKQDRAREEIKKMDAASKQKAAGRYQQIQKEIHELEMKRKQEEQACSKGPTGQKAETTLVKQLEVSQQPTAKLPETKADQEKKKLPPVNVQRERTKAERFRGAAG